jgi:hypothetical protein
VIELIISKDPTWHVSPNPHLKREIDPYKICHGGDNEERRFLGYRNPIRTSPEKYYLFARELSRLMLM